MAQRLPPLSHEEMSADQKRVYELLAAGRARGVAGPLMAYLRNPKLAEIGQTFGTFCRRETEFPARLSELAILLTVAHWKSAFQWHGHEKLGLAEGLSPQTVAAIKAGQRPELDRPDEAAVHAFVSELLETHTVSAETYARAEALFGGTALVELVALVGYYVWGAMTVNAFTLDPGPEGDPFSA